MKSKFRKNTNMDQWGPNNFSCRGQFFEKWFKYTILPTVNNFLKLKKYIYKKLKQYLFFFFLDFNLWCLLGRNKVATPACRNIGKVSQIFLHQLLYIIIYSTRIVTSAHILVHTVVHMPMWQARIWVYKYV